MKKHNMILIGALICTFVLAGGSVNTQTQVHLFANIPFDFSLGNRRLSAGKYTIERVDRSSANNAFIFREVGGKKASAIMTFNVDLDLQCIKNGPTLSFNRYGNEYFLAEISNPYETYGARVARSTREKETARLFRGEALVATVVGRKD